MSEIFKSDGAGTAAELESVETFADALRFQETLMQRNRVKREAVFKRFV